MANEDSTAFTETEQDGKNIQCPSSGNGISMNGFFLLTHEISSEPIDTLEVSIGVLAYQLSQLLFCKIGYSL
ncbi:MAG: hypothetical protein SOX40_01185 [Bacteroidaceae bacterium]|nr:hypothetical protein [Bacteroidaceae bacterium]